VGLPNKIIGNPNPDYTANFTNTFTYKDFSLSCTFEYVKGGSFYSTTAENLLRRGVTEDTAVGRESSFVIPGVYGDPNTGQVLTNAAGNTIPNQVQIDMNGLYFLNVMDVDQNKVYDATRVRFRDLAFTYNVPSKYIKKAGIAGMSVSLTGQNLWLYTFNMPKHINVDPGVVSTGKGNGMGLDFQTAPTAHRYGMTVKLTF
jgi:hypothetical protein